MVAIDIQKLSELARVAVSPDEKEILQKDIMRILNFVALVSGASVSATPQVGSVHNVFREDADTHESGLYTKELVDAMPRHTPDGYLQVRKIIDQD